MAQPFLPEASGSRLVLENARFTDAMHSIYNAVQKLPEKRM